MRLTSLVPGNLPNLEALTPKVPADEVKNLGSISAPQAAPQSGPLLSGATGGRAFSDFLGDMVAEVNAKQGAAAEAAQGVLAGDNVPLHSAMLAMEEASVSFQLMVEVRNKLMESYQELMRMQI